MALFTTHPGMHYVLQALRLSRRRALFIFVLDLLAGLLSILRSLFLAQTIAVFFGFHSLRAQVAGIALNRPVQGLLVLTFLIGAKLLCDYFRWRWREQLADAFIHFLRASLMKHHFQRNAQEMDKKAIGQALLRFSGELGAVRSLLTRGVLQVAADATLLVLGLIFIFCLNVVLGIIVLAALCLIWFVTRHLNNRLQAAEVKRRAKKTRLFRFIHDNLSHIGTIQALNRQTRVLQRFERYSARLAAAEQHYYGPAAWSGSLPWFWVQTLLVLVLAGAAVLQTVPAALFAVVLLMMSWRSPLARLLRAGSLWKKGLLSLRRIERVLQSTAQTEGTLEIAKNTSREITFEQVVLQFGEKTVFKALDFTLTKGRITTLHLGSGQGKTTIVRLLAGIYTPSAGRIRCDGHDARQFTAHSLRRQLAFVSEAFPLSGNNISDALSNSSKPEALENARAALRDWQTLFPALRELPPLSQLSSGQQILLQCLRAKLSDKPFWILDDPFSRLDAESAWLLEQILLQAGKTKGILLLKNIFLPAVTFSSASDIQT